MMLVRRAVEKLVSLIPYKARLFVYHTPFIHMGRKILSKVMPSTTLVEITGGPLRGFRMWIDLKCQKYYWLGTYEPAVSDTLGKVIQPGWVCYDVGAHIGYFSLMMAQLTGVKGKVFAFEPDPDNFRHLNEHIQLNDMNAIIEPAPMAVSSESGKAVFQKGKDSSTGKLSSSSFGEGIEVDITSLDDFVYQMGHPEPDFIKIDVEGFEGKVLSGAGKVLSQARPVVLCEIHNTEAAQKVLKKLEGAEYLIFHVEGDLKPVRSLHSNGHYVAYHRTGR